MHVQKYMNHKIICLYKELLCFQKWFSNNSGILEQYSRCHSSPTYLCVHTRAQTKSLNYSETALLSNKGICVPKGFLTHCKIVKRIKNANTAIYSN